MLRRRAELDGVTYKFPLKNGREKIVTKGVCGESGEGRVPCL